LWHHPSKLAGDYELDPGSERRLALDLLALEGCHLQPNEVLSFQNVPSLRSIPTIAHSHVFLRPRPSSAHAATLAKLRHNWRERSPWLTRAGGVEG